MPATAAVSWSTRAQRLTNSQGFEAFIFGVILLTAVVVGLETSPAIMAEWGPLLKGLDRVILGIFVIEILLRMAGYWPKVGNYFRNGWNLFDFTLVAIALVPATGPWVAVIRLARILRIVRLVRVAPRLRVLVGALLKSLPSMGYVVILMAMHFYIYAVIGVTFFRDNDPWHFGSLGDALLTLFRVSTLEDWTDVMYINVHGSDVYAILGATGPAPNPQAFGIWAVLYFVSFVVLGALVIINLLVGVMVSSISESAAELHAAEEARAASRDSVLEQLRGLEEQIRALRAVLASEKAAGGSAATTEADTPRKPVDSAV